MPLIPKVGRTRGKNLAILIVFYVLLGLGGVTMIIPFLMTLTTSVTNQYDLPQYNVVPRFLYEEDALFIKYLFHKYTDYETIKNLYRVSNADTLTELSEAKNPLQTRFAPLEFNRWDTNQRAVARRDWADFWEERRRHATNELPVVLLYRFKSQEKYQEFLRAKYLARWQAEHPAEAARWDAKTRERAPLALLNHTYGTTAGTEFRRIAMRPGMAEFGRLAKPDRGPRTEDYREFVRTLSAGEVTLADEDGGISSFCGRNTPRWQN